MEALYQRLEHPDSVRLLKFPTRCASNETLPQFDLVTTRLLTFPLLPYQALSYTWGDDDAHQTILLNGIPVLIRTNLWQFLDRALSSRDLDVDFLFVDALCICQTDLGEKAAQVQQMAEIFRLASRVLVWLGVLAQPFPNEIFKEGERSTAPSKAILDRAMHVPYWSRLWVIKEFMLAKDLLVCYGKHTWTYQQLVRHWNNNELSDQGMAYELNADSLAPNGSNAEIMYTCGQTLTWRGNEARRPRPDQSPQDHDDNMHLFKAFGRSECSVRLDKVYGLIGLVTWEGLTLLQVDYTINEVELYFRALSCLKFKVSFLEAEDLRRALQLSPDELLRKSIGRLESGSLANLKIAAELYIDQNTVGDHWDLSDLPVMRRRNFKQSVPTSFYLHQGSLQAKDLTLSVDGTDLHLIVRKMADSRQYMVGGIAFRYRSDDLHQVPTTCTDDCGGILGGIVLGMEDATVWMTHVDLTVKLLLAIYRHQWIRGSKIKDEPALIT